MRATWNDVSIAISARDDDETQENFEKYNNWKPKAAKGEQRGEERFSYEIPAMRVRFEFVWQSIVLRMSHTTNALKRTHWIIQLGKYVWDKGHKNVT